MRKTLFYTVPLQTRFLCLPPHNDYFEHVSGIIIKACYMLQHWYNGVLFLQKEKLSKIRQTRDQESVDSALAALTAVARSGEGNLLDLSIKAARVRCTVGEITQAMEAVHKRHVASTSMVRGAYLSEHGETDEVKETLELVRVS